MFSVLGWLIKITSFNGLNKELGFQNTSRYTIKIEIAVLFQEKQHRELPIR